MSTKIYEAYRFSRCYLDQFIPLFNRICIRMVLKDIKAHVPKLNKAAIGKARRDVFGKNSKAAGKISSDEDIALCWILAQAMMESKTGINGLFNYDSSFNLWIDGDWCYVIPYVPRCVCLEKRLPEWCNEFVYWNNTDPKDDVSEQEWAFRKRTWDRIAVNDWDKTRLTHIVIELKMPYLNGLQRLINAITKDEDRRDLIYSVASSLFWKEEKLKKEKKSKDDWV